MKNDASKNESKLFIGVDLGTSAMKVVLVDEEKNILAQTEEKYNLSNPQEGWSEIDPEIWYQCMLCSIRKVLDKKGAKRLLGISVTGQMHTIIPLGKDGIVLRPAIMWNDMRTKTLIPELKKTFQDFSEGAYLANMVSTGSPAAALYWMKKNEPELFSKMYKFLIGPDYLVHRLTGEYTTDYCEASTSCLYQIEGRKWSNEIRQFLGLEESVYPRIGASSDIAGYLTREVREKLGIDQEVFVLYGTGDNPATAISTGCFEKEIPVISLGTSGILMIPCGQIWKAAKGKKILLALEGGKYCYLMQGAVQSTGNTIDWWVKKISGANNYEMINRLAQLHEIRENAVMFYPHLMGEKTIHGDANLRGAFVGLGIETENKDMLYAVLEGICMGLKELAEKMKVPLERYEYIEVVGGGAKNDIWMQILANVLNKKVVRLQGMVGAAYGAALLAVFRWASISMKDISLTDIISIDSEFEPNQSIQEVLERRYKKYCRIYNAVKSLEEI